MTARFTSVLLLGLLFTQLGRSSAQSNPPKGIPTPLGRAPGAPKLEGYLVQGAPLIPIKKFAAESGARTSVSPSGASIAVFAGTRKAIILNAQRVLLNDKEIQLSVAPVARNDDVYLPMEFYEKLFPAHFSYNSKSRKVIVELPGKMLTVPIVPLPLPPKKGSNSDPERPIK